MLPGSKGQNEVHQMSQRPDVSLIPTFIMIVRL